MHEDKQETPRGGAATVLTIELHGAGAKPRHRHRHSRRAAAPARVRRHRYRSAARRHICSSAATSTCPASSDASAPFSASRASTSPTSRWAANALGAKPVKALAVVQVDAPVSEQSRSKLSRNDRGAARSETRHALAASGKTRVDFRRFESFSKPLIIAAFFVQFPAKIPFFAECTTSGDIHRFNRRFTLASTDRAVLMSLSVGDPVGSWTAVPAGRRCGLIEVALRSRRAGSGKTKEIEKASSVRQECAKPDWTRRFIRGASRGCKVRGQLGFIIDPAVDGNRGDPRNRGGHSRGTESRGEPELSHRHRRRTEAPGRSGARSVGGARDQRSFGVTRRFSLAKPEGEQTGATRGDSSAGAGRCRFWGNPEPGRRRYRRIAVRGNPETINRHRRSIRTSTRLEDRSPVKPEDAARGATCSEHRRRSRKREEPGQPGALQPAALKDARFESPRKSVAGNSQRIVLRGNPKTRSPTQPMDA